MLNQEMLTVLQIGAPIDEYWHLVPPITRRHFFAKTSALEDQLATKNTAHFATWSRTLLPGREKAPFAGQALV
jgi:hypothetical protein